MTSSRSTLSPRCSARVSGRREGSGTFSASAIALATTTARGIGERVHRRDPQPCQMRWRLEVGFECRPSRRIDVDRPGRQERLHVARQVPRGAVIGRDDQDRSRSLPLIAIDQRREQVGAHRRGDVGVHRAVGFGHGGAERAQALVLVCDLEQWSQRHLEISTTNARIVDPGRVGRGCSARSNPFKAGARPESSLAIRPGRGRRPTGFAARRRGRAAGAETAWQRRPRGPPARARTGCEGRTNRLGIRRERERAALGVTADGPALTGVDH